MKDIYRPTIIRIGEFTKGVQWSIRKHSNHIRRKTQYRHLYQLPRNHPDKPDASQRGRPRTLHFRIVLVPRTVYGFAFELEILNSLSHSEHVLKNFNVFLALKFQLQNTVVKIPAENNRTPLQVYQLPRAGTTAYTFTYLST